MATKKTSAASKELRVQLSAADFKAAVELPCSIARNDKEPLCRSVTLQFRPGDSVDGSELTLQTEATNRVQSVMVEVDAKRLPSGGIVPNEGITAVILGSRLSTFAGLVTGQGTVQMTLTANSLCLSFGATKTTLPLADPSQRISSLIMRQGDKGVTLSSITPDPFCSLLESTQGAARRFSDGYVALAHRKGGDGDGKSLRAMVATAVDGTALARVIRLYGGDRLLGGDKPVLVPILSIPTILSIVKMLKDGASLELLASDTMFGVRAIVGESSVFQYGTLTVNPNVMPDVESVANPPHSWSIDLPMEELRRAIKACYTVNNKVVMRCGDVAPILTLSSSNDETGERIESEVTVLDGSGEQPSEPWAMPATYLLSAVEAVASCSENVSVVRIYGKESLDPFRVTALSSNASSKETEEDKRAYWIVMPMRV